MANPSEEIRQKMAREIAKEAVIQMNIAELKDDAELFTKNTTETYYRFDGNETTLTIAINPTITSTLVTTHLARATWNIVEQLNSLLSKPKNCELFNVAEDEKTDIIYEHTMTILKNYILHLPKVLLHGQLQALNEAIISHIKKFVEYELSKHWEELKLQKNYSLVPNNDLTKLIKLDNSAENSLFQFLENTLRELNAYRKTAFTDRKSWLTEERLELLPNDYEILRKLYKEAAKEYKERKNAYFKLNRRASSDDWNKFWEDACNEEFPLLFLPNEIENYTPSELAYKQLGNVFGFSMDYIQKLTRLAKKKAKDKNKKTDN